MNFIKNITQETLIICNEYIKEDILKINKLLPIKIINLQTFKEEYFFSYDEETILYIIEKYNVKYEIAKEYLLNLYYIEDCLYNCDKLDFLVSLKKELDDKKLLKYNSEFKEYLEKVNIIVYGIKIDKFLNRILNKYNYKEINIEQKDYKHIVYEFNSSEEEIRYVAEEISLLIDKGIQPCKIKLMNVTDGYTNYIERIFSLYNLIPGIKHKRKLSSYPLVKEFISKYKDNSLEEVLRDLDNTDSIFGELIKVINQNIKYNSKDLIVYKLEHSYILSEEYTNEIELVDYLEYQPKADEYYFMIGFNESIIPNYYMDTEFLTDNIKKIIDIETTKELNKELKNRIINIINNIKNLTITYKLKDNKSCYYPSSLITNYCTEKKEVNYNVTYSEKYNKISLAKEYDSYIKFGKKSPLLVQLNNNYKILYNSFSNKYQKIDRIMNKLTLSYSKMQTYNKCAFRYYLSDILKIDIFEENFSTVIGNMVHFIMEKCLSNNDYDVDKYANKFLEGKKLSKKELFFLEKYKKEIHYLLNQIILEKEYLMLDKAMYEKRIDIDYGNNIHFVGVIDKILYYEDVNNTYIALVDYKTGNDEISLKYFNYGINIQLPIYLYLSSYLLFKNPIYTGFYLQKFNISEKDYRLLGYSNSDKDILSYFDNCYNNSKIIKGLKTLKDGSFSKSSKVLSNKEIDNIKEKVEVLIKETIDKIVDNDFDINPKIDNGKNISCEYCKFNDICFKRKEDEISIKVEEFGGDEDGLY